jgi:hypothetical protein
VFHIIRNARRVGDADPLEGKALLTLEPRHRLGRSERQRMRAAVEKVGIEEARHVRHAHRTVGEPALSGRDLDERLEPVRTARAVASQLDRGPPARRLRGDRPRDLARAH